MFQRILNHWDKLGQDNNNVTLIGTDTVAGREAYILSFTPKSDVAIRFGTTQIKAWIDSKKRRMKNPAAHTKRAKGCPDRLLCCSHT